jgi:hypothetical protein
VSDQNLTTHFYKRDPCNFYKAVFKECGSHHVDLEVFEVLSEDDTEHGRAIAIFSCKWDGCSHVGFRDPSLNKDWVHVCGTRQMVDVLKMMVWAWNLCMEKLISMGFGDGECVSVIEDGAQ